MSKIFNLQSYHKSKDYVKSPFRYAGGKFYALKHIMPFMDCVPHDEYREPFVGGGSVFFAKKKARLNWINDLEPDLIKVYKAMQDRSIVDKIVKKLSTEIANRERFEEMKRFTPTSFFEQVYRTYYLNRTAYCGIINKPAWGYMEKKSAPPSNWGKFLIDVLPKLQDVKITNLDFSDVIEAPAEGNSVLMYLDPPYFKADQKRAYTQSFVLEDHIRLAELLRHTDFYFCLSYDDVEEVRDLYSWAYIHKVSWLYNTANKKGESRKKGDELVITNYRVMTNDLFNRK